MVLLAVGSFLGAIALMSVNASAESLSGNWGSRISGEGYSQTYLSPSGMVTDYFDAELDLTESGGNVVGTVTVWENGVPESYNVDGTFDGTTFYMTAYYGWDGVSMLTPTYTLTVSGNSMTGSGSYLNVGVTIYGTFDLVKKGSLFIGLEEYRAVIGAGVSVLGIIGLAVLILPSPKPGFKPVQGPYTYNQATSTPSIVSETNPHAPTGLPGPAQPQGGIGITYGTPDTTIWKGPGSPPPPKEWYSSVSQQPPQCPIHPGTHVTPHFSGIDDPGSWYCPRCNAYPWGGRKVV